MDTPNLAESIQDQTPAHRLPPRHPVQSLPTPSICRVQPTTTQTVLRTQAASWQSQCTHLAKTRLFIAHEDERCDECHLRPPLGWLYVCTDDNNNVPPKDGNPLLTRDCSSSSLDPPVIKETDLSSWIVRAIAQGHYSQQQIDTLIRQKANVRDTVAETRNRDQRSTVTHLVIQSSSDVDNCEDDDEEAWMEDVEEVHETQEVTAESSRIYVQGPQVNDILSSMVGPRCSSFCHTCRPSFRERSWASLNAACTEASNNPPQRWERSETSNENSSFPINIPPQEREIHPALRGVFEDWTHTALATIGYTSHALHHFLSSKPSTALQGRLLRILVLLRQSRRKAACMTVSSSPPSEKKKKTPAEEAPLLALSSLLSETRFTLRLLGLVSAWKWGSDTVRSPPKDRVLRAIAFLQVLTYVLYQSLENLAYLASKGIAGKRLVDRWGGGVDVWYLWSTRAWLSHVVLDFIKLGRENSVKKKMKKMMKKTDDDEEEVRKWRKTLLNNLIWAPLYVHWSLERGIGVPESLTGLVGLIAGAWGLHDSWKATAKSC
ncbi:hypothetical protein V8E54_014472 [Elaphomyces granulatus]